MAVSSEPLRSALVRSASLRSMRALPKVVAKALRVNGSLTSLDTRDRQVLD